MYAIVINYLYFQWLREKERTVSKETARSKIGGEEEMEQKKKISLSLAIYHCYYIIYFRNFEKHTQFLYFRWLSTFIDFFKNMLEKSQKKGTAEK